MAWEFRFGFIGAGEMASAIADGMIRRGLCRGEEILLSSRGRERLERAAQSLGARVAADNDAVVARAQNILLAVKPQQFPAVCAGLRQKPEAGQTVISIMAGISLETLAAQFPRAALFRAMPNTPAKIGWGMTGVVAGPTATAAQKEMVDEIFSSVGRVVFVEESYIDALGAVSGSGPAYLYEILEAMADGAVLAGLPRALAYQLAGQTMAGAAMMLLETGAHPAVLKDQVTSPGGTTICGLRAMEARGVRSAMMEAVQAAFQRSKELGQTPAAPPTAGGQDLEEQK